MSNPPSNERPKLLSPRARALLGQLQDYSQAVFALIDKGEGTPSAIGRELFSRTIGNRTTNGPWPALSLHPLILSAFSNSELHDWADAIANDGGNVDPILTAWHLYELATESLPLPNTLGIALAPREPITGQERKRVRQALGELKDTRTTRDVIEQLSTVVGEVTPWLRNIATGWTVCRAYRQIATKDLVRLTDRKQP